jgi:hypothetical protein
VAKEKVEKKEAEAKEVEKNEENAISKSGNVKFTEA